MTFPGLREQRDTFVRSAIVNALESAPTIRAAARDLQMTDATLIYHMRRLGISVERHQTLRVNTL